jgi:hypothetical protein
MVGVYYLRPRLQADEIILERLVSCTRNRSGHGLVSRAAGSLWSWTAAETLQHQLLHRFGRFDDVEDQTQTTNE